MQLETPATAAARGGHAGSRAVQHRCFLAAVQTGSLQPCGRRGQIGRSLSMQAGVG